MEHPSSRPARVTLAGAREERLFFAQVREDSALDVEALEAGPDDTVVVVSSGGCTALSLLTAGAGRVVAVDLNVAQNHLVELKAAAVATLGTGEAVAFLGGWPAGAGWRRSVYEGLRAGLSPAARAYWDARRRAVAAGVLGAGVSERFVRVVVGAVRLGVHPPSRVRRLLACRTVEEQRRLYESEWDNRRWRLVFALLLNRFAFRHTYDPAFFRHVENPSFARHFRRLMEHVLADLPVADNYFVHHMLTGSYPRTGPEGLPPYLRATGPAAAGTVPDRLTLVDGSVLDHLRTCPDGSVDGFALSNISEWLDADGIDELMGEIARTASDGARVVLRNFVGWTEIPERWRPVVVEDRRRGEALVARDRSGFQRRMAVCRVAKGARPEAPAAARHRVRPAAPADNDALVALAAACPMEGDVGLCVDRAPDFFALNRLEGEACQVGVVDGPAGTPVGCVAVAERRSYLHGRPARTMYVGDLKVAPEHRGSGVADALGGWARDRCREAGGDDVVTLVTVLAGNRAMMGRLGGRGGLPRLERFATIRSHTVSLLWRRPVPAAGLRVTRAEPGDVEEMAARWQEVAPSRQLAPELDAASLAAWVEAAPGLDLSSYLLARRADGRLAGFVGLWDQESFKQLRVTSYSRKLAAVRLGLNAVSPLVGATPLPPAGGRIRHLTAVHVCVAGAEPAVLRALLLTAYGELRGQGYSFLTVGLDVADPLGAALSGLLAQPTDVWACVATPAGDYAGPPLGDRPVHAEIALV